MSLLDRRERRVLAWTSRLVPAKQRPAWRREWDGELGALAKRAEAWPGQRRRLAREAVRVAFRDALWLRCHPRRRSERPLRRASLALHAPIEPRGEHRLAVAWRELSFGLRRLRRSPGYSATAIAFSALTLAAAIIAFSLLHAIVLAPLAYSEPERLVRIVGFDVAEGQTDWMSMAELEMLRGGAATLESVSFSTVFPATWERPEGRSRVQRALVSPDYFSLLGARPHRGRLLTASHEDTASAVVSHRFWRRHWPGDEPHGDGSGARALGQTLTLDGEVYTVVGVAAPSTYTHELAQIEADVWLVWPRTRPMRDLDFRIFTGLARLAPGQTVEAARAEALGLAARLAADRPDAYGGWQLALEPLKDTVVGASRRSLVLIFAALGLLLLGMCANLANLVLVRLVGRRGELAVHMALGGHRGVVARQLATESVLLASAGGLAGWLIAGLAVRWLPGRLPFDLPRLAEVELDGQVLIFALLATLLAAMLSGGLPAWLGARAGIAQALRTGGRRQTARVAWMRAVSIVVQVAVALPLLVAAGLLARSLGELDRADLGLRPAGVMSARVSVELAAYPQPADRAAFFDGVVRDLRARPWIEAAGAILQAPLLADQHDRTRFTVDGAEAEDEESKPRALVQVMTPGALETLGVGLLAGRGFDRRDDGDGPPVVIISESLWRRYLPDQVPVGRRLTLEVIFDGEAATRTVIGVARDVTFFGPGVPAEPTIYLPHGQVSWPSMALVVRAGGVFEQAVRALREVVREREDEAVIEAATLLPNALRGHLAVPRAAAALVAVLAVIATALCLLGLYALLAYDVAQHEHEVAVRMALGATAGAIRGRLLARASLLVAVGVAVGLLLAGLVARALRSLVFGVPTIDPSTFALATVALGAVALGAVWLPATRATKIRPATALREG